MTVAHPGLGVAVTSCAFRSGVVAGFAVAVGESPTAGAVGPAESAAALGPAGKKADVGYDGELRPDWWCWWFGGWCGIVVGSWEKWGCGVISLGWAGPLGTVPLMARVLVSLMLVLPVLAGAVDPSWWLAGSV